MVRISILLLLLALPAFVSAVTQQDCTNQLSQCIMSTCTQAGCQLSGTECYCTPAEEAQWDALADAQCQNPYLTCVQSISSGGNPPSGGSTSGSSSSSDCCGSAFVLLFGAAGIMLAKRV